MSFILSYDLGTGGMKSSLFDEGGRSVASCFVSCNTFYSSDSFREQVPADWWEITCRSTRMLVEKVGVDFLFDEIVGIAISGHSLGVVPLSSSGELLMDRVPIWSDSRGSVYTLDFFGKMDEGAWYEKTGNGFPAGLYSLFKVVWIRENLPEVYAKTTSFLGTKDYLNFMLTGVMATDVSYASGSGLFDLESLCYDSDIAEFAGVDLGKFPEVVASSQILGALTGEAAVALGLPSSFAGRVSVVCGGVDNSCMAAGAGCVGESQSYLSLGTSAWIAISSAKPVIDLSTRPYVFAHIVPSQYVSANAIFSAGNSFRWLRGILFPGVDGYGEMEELAAISPVGSNGLLFNPSMAGGTLLDVSPEIRGGWSGLQLSHSRGDLVRSALEGIAFNLKVARDALDSIVPLTPQLQIVGGGGKSAFWRQIIADVFDCSIDESPVGEDAGALGAASCAFVGCEIWSDFSPLLKLNETIRKSVPNPARVAEYRKMEPLFAEFAQFQARMGEKLAKLRSK